MINLEPNQQAAGVTYPTGDPAKEKGPVISMLENPIHYFLNAVYIVGLAKNLFRLIVVENGKLATHEDYGSSKGAKIAFLKFHGYKGFKRKKIKAEPDWSHFYEVQAAPWRSKHNQIITRG